MNKKAGVHVKKYDGGTTCHKHVWTKKDKGCVCPSCQGPRYDAKGHLIEQVIHFPIKPRLEALMRDSFAFEHAVKYEKYRSAPREKHKGVMAGSFFLHFVLFSFLFIIMMMVCVDVFDTPRWKEMESKTDPKTLLLRLLACVDGIPAFTCNGITLMPFEFMLLSLPPWLRYKVDNMFISMLIPSNLSPEAQRKYFEKVIE